MIAIDVILAKYGKEQAAVVMICRAFAGSITIGGLSDFFSVHEIDWDKLYGIIAKNRIRPVANDVLSSINIPPDFKQKLKADNSALAIKSISHLNELLGLTDKLAAGGVQVIPYKGIVFSAAYYPNFTFREFTDLDFLILLKNENDLETVYNIFKDNGYIPMHDNPDDIQETIIKNTCEFYFNKYDNGNRKFHVDFHWVCHHPVFDLPKTLPNQILFKNPETITISNKPVIILNTNSNFTTIVIHHGVRESWKSLKHVLDLAQLIKTKSIDWQYVFALSDEYKFTNVQSSGIQLVSELLGIEADAPSLKKQDISRYMYAILSGKPKKRSLFSKQVRIIWLMDDNNARLKMIYNTIVYAFQPSILDYKLVPLPKQLYFLYLFVKLFRILTSPFRKTN